MKKFVALFSFLLLGFYISIAQCPDYNSKSVAAYRDNHSITIGKIKIIADYAGSYKVSLFHSDQPTTAFRSWNFKQNEQLVLSTPKDGQLNLANDWGIQIEFENGVKSCVKFVGNLASFKEGMYVIKTTSIYNN